MAQKCKHAALVRIDDQMNRVTKSTPRTALTDHYVCEECKSVFYSMMSSKPMLVEQLAES